MQSHSSRFHKVHAHNLSVLQFIQFFHSPFAFLSFLAETGFVASQKRREAGRTVATLTVAGKRQCLNELQKEYCVKIKLIALD